MTSNAAVEKNAFYSACCKNDLNTVKATVNRSEIDAIGPDGNTALHAASSHGHVEVVDVLLRYHANRTIRNIKGLTAQQVAKNDQTKMAFDVTLRTVSDSDYFVASEDDVEWLDTYKNAYRISYENHEHMKRWLTKVALQKLLNEIDTGYIDNIEFANEKNRAKVKEYLGYVIEYNNPIGLLQIYTDPGTKFHAFLNHDLAEIGSDFRFVSTQSLISSGYLDNEAPKGLGQYIFASLIINHPCFRKYHHTGVTYRGMKITRNDLQKYERGKIVMTRSFLSTSKLPKIALLFLDVGDYENHPPVICIYKVTNPRSSLYIQEMSQVRDEEEVLIIPFTVFEVIEQQEIENTEEDKPYRFIQITLEERSQTQA